MTRRQAPLSVPLVHGSREWHAWRQTGVGSSDVPVITGDAPYGDISALYQEKLGYAAPMVESDYMRAGKRLEDVVARWWAEEAGHRVRQVHRGLRHRETTFAIASLDREANVGGRLRPLEVKTAESRGDSWGEPGSDQIPDAYYEQVQWQALVTGADVVELAVFFFRARRVEPYRVPRDQATIDELITYAGAFWRCVTERTPPDPVGRTVRALLRADEVEADASITALARLHRALEAELAEAEAEKKRVDDQLRAFLADVGGARGDGFRIHHRYNRDGTETDWAAVARAYGDRLRVAGTPSEELDRVVADLTTKKPGARPLRVAFTKERKPRAA